MNSAKIQKIGGDTSPDPQTGEMAAANIEEPADLSVLASRGSLYSVIDFKGVSSPTSPMFGRLVWDTLKDRYYDEIEGTPMQALEKAVTAVRERLLGLSLNPQPQLETSTDLALNLVVAVKWGQFLYTAVMGEGKIFLIRGMGVKEIVCEASQEVNYTSHPLDNDDIVMLTSKNLATRLAPETLLTTLGTLESDLGKSPTKASELALIIKNLAPLTRSTGDSGKKTLVSLVRHFHFWSQRGSGNNISSEPKKTKLLGILVLFLGVVLVGSLALSLRPGGPQAGSGSPKKVLGDATVALSNQVSEISSNLSIDPTTAKTELVAAFTALNNLSPEDKRSKNYQGLVDQLNSLKIKAYQISSLPSWKEASMPAVLGLTRSKFQALAFDKKANVTAYSEYVGFLYLVDPMDSQIYKATPSGKSFTVATWLKSAADVGKGLGISVDGDVWVLDSATIKKFYRNESTLFTISGIDQSFNNPVALFTDGDTNNLYVYDAGNNRLVAIDKNGVYQFQVTLPAVSFPVKNLIVSEKLKTFIIAGDSKALEGNFQ